VIINIPSPEDLNDVALRLYFSAWSDLINMLAVFDQHFEVLPEEELTDERRDYLELCQPELQSIVTVIQQSNELRLKALICEISPLLLLLRNDQKLNKIHKDTEFSEFKTLDDARFSRFSGTSRRSECFVQGATDGQIHSIIQRYSFTAE
jgi:hypothetical protein